MRDQFESLILHPLTAIESSQTLTIVVDALDECDGDPDVRAIIYYLSQAKSLRSVRLKTFLTSRPDLPLDLALPGYRVNTRISSSTRSPSPSSHTTSRYFWTTELAKVRDDYNLSVPSWRQLPSDWPGKGDVATLVDMAVPLFIYAATICRFVGDRRGGGPVQQLARVLQYQASSLGSKLAGHIVQFWTS